METLRVTSNPWISGAIWGIACSAIYLYLIPYNYSSIILALFSAAMPGVYWGFGVKSSSKNALIQETVALYFFFFLTSYLMVNYPRLLVIAVGAHGIYDCMHHFKVVKYRSHVPSHYAALCAATDFTICIILLWNSGYFRRYY